MAIRIMPARRVRKVKTKNSQEVLQRLEEYLESECDDPVEILCGFWKDQQDAITYQELRQTVLEGVLTTEALELWQQDYSILITNRLNSMWTKAIEAAMMAADMAPGMNREFLSEDWKNLIPRKCWYAAMDEAGDLVRRDVKVDIQGYDIDGEIIRAARANAKAAGVDHMIHFQQRPVSELSHPKKYGFIITNPPYGERIEEKKNLPELYRTIGERYQALDSWSAYIITAYEDAERYFGRKADKNRKIYNGMMKTYFYQFQGPKPSGRIAGKRNEEAAHV